MSVGQLIGGLQAQEPACVPLKSTPAVAEVRAHGEVRPTVGKAEPALGIAMGRAECGATADVCQVSVVIFFMRFTSFGDRAATGVLVEAH